MEQIKLTIDNQIVEVPKGTTIYHAAKKLGIHIPVLCYMKLDDLNIENKPGGCRVCVVEVEGRKKEIGTTFTSIKPNFIRSAWNRQNI